MSITVDILLRLIDQLSGPAKAAEQAVNGVGQAVDGVGKTGGGIDRAVSEMKKLGAAAADTGRQMQLLKQGFGNVGKGLAIGLTTGVAFWATKAATAISFTRRELIGTMAEFERYQAILTTVQGSPEKAKKSAAWALDFAYYTPYEVGEVVDSMTRLAAYGVVNLDNLKDTEVVMKAIGDAASAMGKQFPDAVEAVFKATMGEYESLKSLGVVMRKNGKQISMEYADASGKIIKKMVKDDRRVIRDALVDIFKQRYDGGMKRQAQTIGSLLVNMGDAWTKLKLKIADSGVGDEMRKQLEGGMAWLDDFFAAPESKLFGGVRGRRGMKEENSSKVTKGDSKADVVARKISDGLAVAMREVIDVGKKAAGAIQWLYEATDAFVKTDLGQAIGGWKGLAGAIAMIKFTPAIWFVGKGLAQIAAATAMLSIGAVVDLAGALALFAKGQIFAGVAALGLMALKFAAIATAVTAAYIALETFIALMNGGLTDGQVDRFSALADMTGLEAVKSYLAEVKKIPPEQRAARFGEAVGETGKKIESGLNNIPGLAALTDAIFGKKTPPTAVAGPAAPISPAPVAPVAPLPQAAPALPVIAAPQGRGTFRGAAVPTPRSVPVVPPPAAPPTSVPVVPRSSGIKVSPATPWFDRLPEIKTPEMPYIPPPNTKGVFNEIEKGLKQGGATAAAEADAIGRKIDQAFDAINGAQMGKEVMDQFAAGIRAGGYSAVGEARSVADQVRGALSGAGRVGGVGGAAPSAPSAVPNRTPGPQSRAPTNNNVAISVPRSDDVKLARAIAREVRGNVAALSDGFHAGAIG